MTNSLESVDCPNCGREQKRMNIHECGSCGRYYCGSHKLTSSGKCLNKKEITYEYVSDELTSTKSSNTSTYTQCPHCGEWWWVTATGITPLDDTRWHSSDPRKHAEQFAENKTEVDGEFRIVDVEEK